MDQPHAFPLWVDLGFRLGKVPYLGFFFQYGKVSTDGSCGASSTGHVSGLSGDSTLVAGDFKSCTSLGGGLNLLFHTMPRSDLDPWFGFHVGLLGGRFDARLTDTNHPGVVWETRQAETLAAIAGFQLGLDWHPTPSFRALVLGPFLSYSHSFFGSDNFKTAANPLPPNETSGLDGGNFSTEQTNVALQLLLGLRVRLGD